MAKGAANSTILILRCSAKPSLEGRAAAERLSSPPNGGRGGPGAARDGEGVLRHFGPSERRKNRRHHRPACRLRHAAASACPAPGPRGHGQAPPQRLGLRPIHHRGEPLVSPVLRPPPARVRGSAASAWRPSYGARARTSPPPPASSPPNGGRGGPGAARDGEGVLRHFGPSERRKNRRHHRPAYCLPPCCRVRSSRSRTSRARPSTPSPSRASPDPPLPLPGGEDPQLRRGARHTGHERERPRRRPLPLPPTGGSEGRARPVARPGGPGAARDGEGDAGRQRLAFSGRSVTRVALSAWDTRRPASHRLPPRGHPRQPRAPRPLDLRHPGRSRSEAEAQTRDDEGKWARGQGKEYSRLDGPPVTSPQPSPRAFPPHTLPGKRPGRHAQPRSQRHCTAMAKVAVAVGRQPA
jgi:hypothetical protein